MLDAFGGGAFRDRGAEAAAEKANLADAIVKTEQRKESHTAGFEAWMRARVRRTRGSRLSSPLSARANRRLAFFRKIDSTFFSPSKTLLLLTLKQQTLG